MGFWRDYWKSDAWVLAAGAALAVLAAIVTCHPYVVFMAAWVSAIWGVGPILYLLRDRRKRRA